MSGTSLDAIDAALVRIEGRGLKLSAAALHFASVSLHSLREPLRALSLRQPAQVADIAELSRAFSLLHLDPIREVLQTERADLIAVHGQTIYHRPPASWQLLTPALIARGAATAVVFNLRAADLAAGGQGAPITPIADYILFRHPTESRAVVNLGGFANFTGIPPARGDGHAENLARVRGGDLCACNQLLDGLARRCLNMPFDRDGATAARGHLVTELRLALIERLGEQARSGRSLGSEHEPHAWLDAIAADHAPADVLATACDAIAATIADALPPGERILLAGGGALNATLRARIAAHAAAPSATTDSLGVPAAQREAVAMAVLGALCQDRVPITLPQITGCAAPAPVAGEWVLA